MNISRNNALEDQPVQGCISGWSSAGVQDCPSVHCHNAGSVDTTEMDTSAHGKYSIAMRHSAFQYPREVGEDRRKDC